MINNLVFVSCMTYNHSSYIKETLDGFCIQQTDFPFVCGIIDDASTDGEPEIINNYLQDNFDLNEENVVRHEETKDFIRIFAKHKTNNNCYFVVVFLKYNHYQLKKTKQEYTAEWRNKARYIAICEGDDYWIDPNKLMKQVRALDNHPELDMCASEALVMQDGKGYGKMAPCNEECVIPTEKVILGGGDFFSTNTLMYRPIIYAPNTISSSRHYPMDYFLQIDGALRGGVYYIPECMAVYRRLSKGSWTFRMGRDNIASYRHKYRVLSTLILLDYETDNRFSEPIEKVINRVVFSMFEKGMFGGCFKEQIKKMTFNRKIKLLLSVIKNFFVKRS